jgi:hypothetical protein
MSYEYVSEGYVEQLDGLAETLMASRRKAGEVSLAQVIELPVHQDVDPVSA